MPKKNEALFKPGNTIGSETRFKPGNTLSRKYKPEHADSMLDYFKARRGMDNPELPTLEGWAVDNNISIRAAELWASDFEKYARFAYNYLQAKAIQKQKLELLGLIGTYNSRLTEFLLKNNHGMNDKVVTDNTVRFEVELDGNVSEEAD